VPTQTIKKKYEGTVVFDDLTGEIYFFDPPKNKKVTSFDKAVGVDTKYPIECVTKDSLVEALCVMDAYLWNDVSIDSDYILDNVLQGYLTAQEASLVKTIAKKLTGWNYYIGNLKELCTSGVTQKNISSVINKLSPNTIQVVSRNIPMRGDIVIKLNPLFAWKGDKEYRQSRVELWYDNLRPTFKGIDTPQQQ